MSFILVYSRRKDYCRKRLFYKVFGHFCCCKFRFAMLVFEPLTPMYFIKIFRNIKIVCGYTKKSPPIWTLMVQNRKVILFLPCYFSNQRPIRQIVLLWLFRPSKLSQVFYRALPEYTQWACVQQSHYTPRDCIRTRARSSSSAPRRSNTSRWIPRVQPFRYAWEPYGIWSQSVRSTTYAPRWWDKGVYIPRFWRSTNRKSYAIWY